MGTNLFLDNVMLLLLASITISVIISWATIKIAPKVGLMDIPGSAEHKNHDVAIPMTGGIVLIDTIFILMITTGMWSITEIKPILISGLIIGLFGLADDYFHLSPLKKLFGQIFGSIVLIYLGIQVNIRRILVGLRTLFHFLHRYIWKNRDSRAASPLQAEGL